MKKTLFLTLTLLLFQSFYAGELIVKVIDVGNGLGCIIKTPNDKYIVYDAGHYNKSAMKIFKDEMLAFVPLGSIVETMFLSHSDADHIGCAGWIIENYDVKRLYRTGLEKTMLGADRSTVAYKALVAALKEHPEVVDINLNKLGLQFEPGSSLFIDGVQFTFLSGYGEPPVDWGKLNQSKKLNSVSLVVRMKYLGKTVLFCGDEVGSAKDKTGKTAEYAEKFMLELLPDSLIDSDVIISSHHGAENGNSIPFIKVVSPDYVICTAGTTRDKHPRKKLIKRFTDNGVMVENILCTDRGSIFVKSGEENKDEWRGLMIDGCTDELGDDGIDIKISGTKSSPVLSVKYVQEIDPCLE